MHELSCKQTFVNDRTLACNIRTMFIRKKNVSDEGYSRNGQAH